MFEKECALEGCGERFTASHPRKRFCSPKHARADDTANRRGVHTEPAAKSLNEVIGDASRRDEERQHRAELKKFLALERRQRRLEDVLSDALRAYEPTELAAPPSAASRKRQHLPVHEDILVTSDWHVGQLVTLDQTGGIYEQSVSATRAQVAKIWKAVEHLHRIDTSGRTVRKLHHLFLGDIVESDLMRESQARKIEDVVTVQTIQGFDLLAWLIRQELTIYDEVEVDLTGGNHDRISRKAGDAGLGELSYVDNFTWLCGAFLERVLAEDIKSGRLKIRNWTTFFGYKEVLGLKVVFEHGSSFKWATGGYGGVPWYSISQLGPKYAAMLGGADLILIGHGHRPIAMPNNRGWIIANGALPATSTYIQAGMKVVSRPMQWKLSIHKEHGITGFVPIYADIPGTLLPGAIWEDPEYFAGFATGTPPSAHVERQRSDAL